MTQVNFSSLSLSPEVQRAIVEIGFEQCTPIQGQAIPYILDGKDIIGQAQTGTGKTAAFGIPLVDKLDVRHSVVQSIVLCPTRELAIQIAEEIQKIAKFKSGIHVLPVYGGQPIERQIRAIQKGVHLIIGTPGRVMDLMERRILKFDHVKVAVLDEADEMLNMGFRDDIEHIFKTLPDERQIVFFSATMPKDILALTRKYQKDPVTVAIEHKELTVSNIDQCYLDVPERNKIEVLSRLLDVYDPSLSLVFCNTKRKVNDVVSELQARGYFADGLHGDLKQNERDAVMEKFRKGIVDILVATDVAARGIDVDKVEAVFNFDVPLDEESYVHRIGRTGRAGKSGRAFTFVAGKDIYQMRDIERYTRSQIPRKSIPSTDEVAEKKVSNAIEEIKTEIKNGQLTRYIAMVESVLNDDQYSTIEVAAALMKLHVGEFEREAVPENQRQSSLVKTGPFVTLIFNAGRQQRMQPQDFLRMITTKTRVPGKSIGKIRIQDRNTFVDVQDDIADTILDAAHLLTYNGIRIRVGLAKPKR
jgi:ATP-dependent RNA helicase DeaD